MTTIEQLRRACPWVMDPELEVSAVGSTALHEGCRRRGLSLPPSPRDVDLAWRLDPEAGRAFLEAKGIPVQSTEGALGRGTLGARIAEGRIEITTYRGGGTDAAGRIDGDAHARDMTIGALYWRLWDDRVTDPESGLADWERGRIRACGDPAERIDEHPIRAVRYVRRAVELGFWIEAATRRAIRRHAREVAARILPEALAEELRRVLADCASPGAFFQMCHEESFLAPLLPEIAPLFDGRPAGRIRWHAEISQGLHMILALRLAAELAERDGYGVDDRVRLLLAVLCHDLGKGRTAEGDLPSHPGHEAGGVPVVEELFRRLPGLGAKRTRHLCKVAARWHLLLMHLAELKPGTLVDLWDRDLGSMREDVPLLVRVVRCDKQGRLMPVDLGMPRRPQAEPDPDYDALEADLNSRLARLDEILRAVSGEESARLHPNDPVKLREHLREARCRELQGSGFLSRSRRRGSGS